MPPRAKVAGLRSHPHKFQYLAAFFCFVFGLCMIANTQLADDGAWYWYAAAAAKGTHLYSDLKLALQPFFILETEWCTALLGQSWLSSKVPAVFHLALLLAGMLAISRGSDWRDSQKAAVFVCAFFVLINFEQYRFDDYHVPTHALCVWSIFLLMRAGRERTSDPRVAALTGLMAGVFITTRLNDGAAFLCAVLLIMLLMDAPRRLQSAAVLLASAIAAVLLVVFLTGDRFGDYLSGSVFRAAGIKGGASNLIAYPFIMPFDALGYLFRWPELFVLSAVALGVAAWSRLMRPYFLGQASASSLKAVAGTFLLLIAAATQVHEFLTGVFIAIATAAAIPVCYLSGAVVTFRALLGLLQKGGAKVTAEPLLVLIPLGLLASGAMSTAGNFWIYAPVGILILIMPFVFAGFFAKPERRRAVVAISTVLALSGAAEKWIDPASWHSYRAPPMFTNRTVFDHPVYGPMVIDKPLLALFDGLCRIVRRDGPAPSVLSLPYPYINYFCAIPPWKNYIQTFFDTSGPAVIEPLIEELGSNPPDWILYQEQPENLSRHERTFNGGRPLPHRALDDLIRRKTLDGEWRVVAWRGFGAGSEWFLIRTHPGNRGESRPR
jgi:hypothetical protein